MAAALDVGAVMVDAPGERDGAANGARVLVINPNTNPTVTALVRQAAEATCPPGVTATVLNPDHGPFSIESDRERAEAEAVLLPLVAHHAGSGFGAMVLACFDDIGLDAARRMAGVPVISACEAGIAAAKASSRRFAVVTTVESAVPAIRNLLARYGAPGVPVRAAGIGVAAAAAGERWATARLEAAIRLAIRVDGAEAILLASGGLTGRAEALAAALGIPVIDAIAAAVAQAASAVVPQSAKTSTAGS